MRPYYAKSLNIGLSAGYTDGHVETFKPADAVVIRVIKNVSLLEPYDYGPGDFYLPPDACR